MRLNGAIGLEVGEIILRFSDMDIVFWGSIRGGKGAKLPIYCLDGKEKGKGEERSDSPILCIWLASKMN